MKWEEGNYQNLGPARLPSVHLTMLGYCRELGVPLETVVIGPGRQVTDLYYDWARLREVEEDGALLVRPDKHIGWRSVRLPADPERALHDAMAAILGRNGAT